MEFKGTKGKWKVLFDEKKNISETIPKINCHEIDGISEYVGLIYGDVGGEKSKANALLISKAPEMLEMLKEQYDFIIYCRDNMKDSRGVFNQKALRLQSLIKESTEIN